MSARSALGPSRSPVGERLRAVAQASGERRDAAGTTDWFEEEDALEFVLAAGGLGHWSLDLDTGLLRLSRGSISLLDLEPGQDTLSVDELTMLIHPDDRAAWVSTTERAIMDGGEYGAEHRLVSRSGAIRWVLIRGRVCQCTAGRPRVAGITIDITPHKDLQAERERLLSELARSEERYRLAVRATQDAIYDIDLVRSRVDLVSGGAGCQGTATVDEWTLHVHPDDRDRVSRALQATIDAGERHWVAEYRMLQPDGHWATVSDRAYLVFDADGRPSRMVGAIQDVTARKRQEEFQRQLMGIVSHDLRNPLHAIVLGAETLSRLAEGSRPAEGSARELGLQTRRIASRIRTSADRATRMIHDLLDFTRARLGAGIPLERRDVDLEDVFRSLVDEVSAAHPERSIALRSAGDSSGEFDADRLSQVLTNLLDNALKYSPPGSPVRVQVVGEPGEVMLLVHNDGPPIPPELLARIFEPFQRGDVPPDSAGRSVGLGLYIVKHLVEAHGGAVEVRSTDAEGTDFVVRLPRIAAAASRAA